MVVAVVVVGAAMCSYAWQGERHIVASVYFGVVVGILATWLARGVLRLAGVPGWNSPPGAGLRNPIDAVGLWYRDLATWKQVGLALIVPQAVVLWWLIYPVSARLVRPAGRVGASGRITRLPAGSCPTKLWPWKSSGTPQPRSTGGSPMAVRASGFST